MKTTKFKSILNLLWNFYMGLCAGIITGLIIMVILGIVTFTYNITI